MAKRREGNERRSFGIEVQKGPISMDEQYSLNFRRQPESTMRDLENNAMRQDKMTLTLHTPKK
jgi:hypothetical protein